ncbi:MAG: entericidin A/B family lipoprotein [Chakrabartia sp.]
MKTVISFSLLAALLTLVGCNTIRGIGQDIEKAGSAIEKSAK